MDGQPLPAAGLMDDAAFDDNGPIGDGPIGDGPIGDSAPFGDTPLAAPAAVNPAAFTPLAPHGAAGESAGIDLLLDVALQVSVELGRTRLTIGELLALRAGSVVELDKLAGEPADILVNGTRIARGEVVVVDEKFGVRVLEVVSQAKRIQSVA
jgi:flagellar motor switch protein FliN/FliY